jgi:DNA repair photolyase
MKVVETEAKQIITESRLPDADYVVNPYTGCSFACGYCYASFMGRFVGESIESWGNYVYVKTNAVELFERELRRFDDARRQRSILLSSVTDAWQGLEKKYRLAGRILEILAREEYPGPVSMLTKGPLILRDLETIARLPAPNVGVTVTTTDDAISRTFEAHAPLASVRIEILRAFNDAGIPTYAFVGPLFPHFRFVPDQLERLFHDIREAGTTQVYVEQINLSPYIRRRLDGVMDTAAPELASAYASADADEHRRVLEELVGEMIRSFGLQLRLNRVLDHRKDRRLASARETEGQRRQSRRNARAPEM